MEYKYTINDISTKCNVSLQSLYSLIKKNKEFINENSTRKQRKIYYNQTAMDFFTSYYQVDSPSSGNEEEEQESTIKKSNEEEGQNAPVKSAREEEGQESLKAEISALKAEIDTLKAQLEAKEKERLELLRQNGALILTIQQAQQERMLLLPTPKKSFADKVKSMFKGKAQEN